MAKTEIVTKVFKAVQQWQRAFPMTLESVGETWVMTQCVTDEHDFDAILRLRISLSPDEETVLFRFDVGLYDGDEFTELDEAKASSWCGEGIAKDSLPEAWREEFREMVRRWATVAVILEPTDECVPVKKQDLFRRSDVGLAARLFELAKEEPDVEVMLGTLASVVFAVCDTTAQEDAARYDDLANRFVATFTSVNGSTAGVLMPNEARHAGVR